MRIALTKIRPRRSLTGIGRGILSIIFFALCVAFFQTIYPFLAPNSPPHRGIMVIEGWISDEALKDAVTLFNKEDYDYIACTGTQIEVGQFLVKWHNFAEMTAARLKQHNIPSDLIIVANGLSAQRDRTYTAALALKEKLKEKGITQKQIHLISVGPHGRRSRLLFKKALPKSYKIGITSFEDESYNAKTWWTCSNGVRNIMNELVAYTYSTLFFHPNTNASNSNPQIQER